MNYEIKNSFIKAQIKSFGAELNSLKKCDENFEYIWQANSKYWARHSPVLFPIVGRLKEDSYFYKNKKYSLSQHGFARDKSTVSFLILVKIGVHSLPILKNLNL